MLRYAAHLVPSINFDQLADVFLTAFDGSIIVDGSGIDDQHLGRDIEVAP